MTQTAVKTVSETPIFDRVLDEWLDDHDNRIPGEIVYAPIVIKEVRTPLMQDVIIHGSTPWDAERRERLGFLLEPHRETAATKPMPRPRQPRKRPVAAKGKR